MTTYPPHHEVWHSRNTGDGRTPTDSTHDLGSLEPPVSDHLDTRSRPPSSFADLLSSASRQFAERCAITHLGHTISFAALGRRAAAVAASLTRAGVRPGDTCAVLAHDPVSAAAGFFGVLAAGGVGINLNELYRSRQIEFVLHHASARVLLVGRDALRTLPRPLDTTARIIVLDEIESGDGELSPLERAADDPAQITYTSGSTGQPKGVVMSHANLWAGVRVVSRYLGLQTHDRIASLLPFSFVYGFNQLTTALFTGATLVVERSTLPREVASTLRREQVTVLASVPPLWQQLLSVSDFRDHPLEHLRIMTNAGGRLPPASVRELRRAQPQARLFLMYGLTEVFRSTYLPPEEVDAHPDSMGRAVPESTVYVVREDDTLTAPGEVGELVHGGPSVALGYLGDPEGSARVFRPNPFLRDGGNQPARVVYSGDLVRRDEEGRLYYVSRRDRMIKTLGFRVSPDEICDVIQASGLVTEAAVLSEPDEIRGERIVACVVMRDGSPLPALRRFLGVELPRYMQPVRYVMLRSLPRNPSGKHDLHQLRAQLTSSTGAASTMDASPA